MSTTYWFAVETRPNREYAALAEIDALGEFETYCPQETRLRRTRKGRFVVQHPLMASIVFVGSKVPPIADINSPDHPHPIFKLLNLPAVRALPRSPGGGVHPIRPQIVDGWRVDFVDHLKKREAAGAFDFRPREKTEAPQVKTLKGAFKDQLTEVMKAFYPDVAQRLAA
ncbi:MAG: transcription termination/antitermination NusG family protein [Brevundimonas sp.]|uniref:transcription termination/antitermination NusG family protein n=1 Tax=Brevundimonas sp. TaxID=1871086 RepID=UPI0039192D0D